MDHSNYSSRNISKKFKAYNKEMRDIWESYNLVEFYMKEVHDLVKKDKIKLLQFTLLPGIESNLEKKDIYGAIHHLTGKANPKRALIDSFTAFEHFISFLTETVFKDYPGKLTGKDTDSSNGGYSKLINIIVNSEDKSEIVHKIIEEKVRSIFYGNPSDFFVKDKGKLDFGSYFKENRKDVLSDYMEIVARRNIIIHNNGKVDRKYVRETGGNVNLNKILSIDNNYLKHAIIILRGLSAEAAFLVLKNIYKDNTKGTLLKVYRHYKEYVNHHYRELQKNI